jgi:hypothetical protein
MAFLCGRPTVLYEYLEQTTGDMPGVCGNPGFVDTLWSFPNDLVEEGRVGGSQPYEVHGVETAVAPLCHGLYYMQEENQN